MIQIARRSSLVVEVTGIASNFAMAALLLGCFEGVARAQPWTITYQVDEAQAESALTPDRVDPMMKALMRAKAKIEGIMSANTGNMIVAIDWSPPPDDPTAAGLAVVSAFHVQSISVAKDKLINRATADNESVSEVSMYEAIPNNSIPYRFDSDSVLSAPNIIIPNSLNKHLGFRPVTNQSDGTIYFRPPTTTLDWQFWESKTNLPGKEVFEAAVVHETMHLLGFLSAASLQNPTNQLLSWDVFRFSETDAAAPITANSFTTLARELRPTVEASGITAFGDVAKAYKLSRGTRAGGDGFQAGHWRSYTRLDPQVPVGVMDPSTSGAAHAALGRRFYARADVEALDIMGWNIDLNAVQFSSTGSINLLAPSQLAQIPQGQPITFEWEADIAMSTVSVYVHAGVEISDDNPVRVFYQLPGFVSTATIATTNALPPGEYVWSVVGGLPNRNIANVIDGRFTVVAGGPTCDSVDFNNDGSSFDPTDVDAFFSVFSEGPCIPATATCNDIDFNNDSSIFDPCDYESFLLVFSEGPCTLCGQ